MRQSMRRNTGHRAHPGQIVAAAVAAVVLVVLGGLLFGGAPQTGTTGGGGSAVGTTAPGTSSSGTKTGKSGDGKNDGQDACGSGSVPDVVVSINQWQSVVTRVAGSCARVRTILTNSGVDAHDFEPGAADQQRLAAADIVVVNGAGYDEWASRAVSGRAQVIDAARLMSVKEGSNPHLWFSASARTKVARAVLAALRKRLPGAKKTLQGRYDGWLADERRLEARIADIRKKIRGASGGAVRYAATESVADYLASDLGLRDATPQGYANAARNESEPSPGDIQQFTALLRAGRVRLLIVNTQEEDKTARLLEQAASAGNVPLVRLTETRPRRYSTTIGWITGLVEKFDAALEK